MASKIDGLYEKGFIWFRTNQFIMECRDFDIRKKNGWHFIGFWCKPETKEDAEKLAAVLHKIAGDLAEGVMDAVELTASEAGDAAEASD